MNKGVFEETVVSPCVFDVFIRFVMNRIKLFLNTKEHFVNCRGEVYKMAFGRVNPDENFESKVCSKAQRSAPTNSKLRDKSLQKSGCYTYENSRELF